MMKFADLLPKINNSKSNDQESFIPRTRGIEFKSPREIKLMKNSSRIVATVLREIEDLIKPGMSTQDLDDFAAKRIMEMGAVPSGGLGPGFKGIYGFPASLFSGNSTKMYYVFIMQIFWILILFPLFRKIWNKGIKKYTAMGT